MNKNEEKGIIIDGVDVSTCRNITAIRSNLCECGVQGVEYYNMRCSYNPECYYKQLQREKQKNKKTEKTLKEIEEMIKKDCLVNCEYCDSYDFKECCEKGCLNTEILEKIKEVENERQI